MARFDDRKPVSAADCEGFSRRDFVRALGAGVVGAGVPWIGLPARAADLKPSKGRPSPSDLSETAVARFYKSLNKTQRETICFPFDDHLRTVVKNNWSI